MRIVRDDSMPQLMLIETPPVMLSAPSPSVNRAIVPAAANFWPGTCGTSLAWLHNEKRVKNATNH
jgi:hypothetical protein